MTGFALHRTHRGSTVKVWDLAQRVAHGLLVGSFATAWLLSEGERWRQWHVVAGLVALGVALWRLGWGWLGSRHARFASFIRGPGPVARYLRSLAAVPEHHLGHNPAGGWAIVLLLALTVATAVTGWLGQNELARWAEHWHEPLAKAWMAMVVVHVTGVVVSSLLHAENLVAAMWHGRKPQVSAWHDFQAPAPTEAELAQAQPAGPDARTDAAGLLTLSLAVALSVWLGLEALPRWLGLA
jgi:cytochrome b